MKKVLKRTLAVFLAVVTIFGAAPLAGFVGIELPEFESIFVSKANAAYVVDSGSCGDNVIYKLSSDGLLTISGNGEMSDMKNFRDHMFSGNATPWAKDEVKRVVIEDGVTRIGEYAFSDHYYLTDIQIPDSVVSIGDGVFQYCNSLLTLVLPKNITSIPSGMCAVSDIRYVYIPGGVTTIGYSAFYGINNLIEIEFGGTKEQWNNIVIENGNDCFSEAYMVYPGDSTLSATQSGSCGDNVTWTLTTDGTMTISGNGNMDSYAEGAIGGYYVKYGDGSDHPWFKYRSKIKKIIITSGVVSVGAYAFFDCFNCTSLEIQDGVKTIKDGAFAHMPISSLLLPNSVSTVGKAAFSCCSPLEQVTLSDNIKVIDDKLFEYCYNLKTPTLPKNLTNINYSAFYGCQFDEIIIPATVTYIGHNFAHVDTVRFLGAPPSFDHGEPPAYILMADYWHCLPEYYESYKAIFEKWRAEGVLSDGPICAKLNKTAITLTDAEPTFQLTVSDEMGIAASVTKKWWVEKPEIASVDENGLVTASGHGKTMLHVEISAGGYHSMANCSVATKRNDLMVALLPKDIEADFPVTCGTSMQSFGAVDIIGYQPGKLAETDTSNEYYQQLLALTNDLTDGCTNDEQKAKAIWNWVSTNVTYGGAIGIGTNAAQAYAVYLERKAHCEGFAKLTGFMLYLAGIPSCLVAGGAHMWNIALLDGKWVMIDSTNKEFGKDYNEYATIEWIGFGVDDFCFVIDNTEGVKLAGVGNHYLTEEREGYTSLTVPDFVDIIFGNSFGCCKNLKSVTLPKNIKKIEADAFEDCNKLTDVYYEGSKEQWESITIKEGNDNLTNATITFGTAATGIAVKTPPTKTTYFVGERFDQSGLTLTVTYPDGSTQTVTSGFTCTGFDSITAGTKTITVKYGFSTAEFYVEIKERDPEPEEPTTQPTIKPEEPTIQPEEPTIQPEEPTINPEEPSTRPEEPTEQPEEPTVKPEEPTTKPVVTRPVTSVEIRTPSQTEIKYGDSIILHADVEGVLPPGAKIRWTADNSNFNIVSMAVDGSSCAITPEADGFTTITMTVYDADGNIIGSDSQMMYAKAGFFQKLIAFFKKLFGLTKVIPEVFKGIF